MSEPNERPHKPSLPKNIPDMSLPDKVRPAELTGMSAKPPTWKTGDRVLAPWEPAFLYVGTIVQFAGNEAFIEFGDGDAGWVLLHEIRPFILKLGQKILCRRKMGLAFYQAAIEQVDGDNIVVAFEDGHPDERTTVAALRILADANNRGAKPVNVQSNRAFLQHIGEGFRVWAVWGGNALFAGTVSEVNDAKAFIQFDDGDHSWVPFDQLIPLEVHIGTPVMARRRMGQSYHPARIADVEGERVQLHFDDGDEEWTKLAAVAIPLQPPPTQTGDVYAEAPKTYAPEQPAAPARRRWNIGDLVWAPWEPICSYPGAIAEITDDSEGKGQALIKYSDDGRGWVYLSELRPFQLEPRQKLMCRRQQGAFFFPATVLQIKGEQIQVRYEDNQDTEWTVVAALRIQNDRPGHGAEMLDFGHGLASPKNLRAGDRVWSPWTANMLYAGTVDRMQGQQAHIRYDDGCEAWVMRDQLLRLDIPVGLRLKCRDKIGAYNDVVVIRSEGDRIEVRHDDGATEWTKPVALAFQTMPLGPDAQPTHHAEATQPRIATIYQWGLYILIGGICLLIGYSCLPRT